jgi:signal transduction histidine kinase
VRTIDQGLLRFDGDRKAFTRYSHDPSNPNSLGSGPVDALFEDAEGTLWVGTQGHLGLSRFQRGPPRFLTYHHEAGNPNSLHDDAIWSVQADSRGFLWIGDEDGLDRLDRRTERFRFYQTHPGDSHTLSYNKVSDIREGMGSLWIGTYGGGLDRFDRATGQFLAYRHDPKNPASLSSNSVLSLLIDRQGILWVGTQGGGLDRFDVKTGHFTSYLNDPPDSSPLLVALVEDRAGMLWLGTSGNGLLRFDPRTKQITTHRHNEDPRSLSNDKVNAIHEDRQGRLWIGTQNGLDLLDRSRGSVTIFTIKEGLPDNAIESILEDAHGFLWLGTHHGISRFDPQARTFRNYSESDGLAGNMMDPHGARGSCETPDGAMVFGSTNGVTIFYPERLQDNPHAPPVVLTDLVLSNKPAGGVDSPLHRPIWASDSLTLTDRQNAFTVEFASLSYVAPQKNRYRYRLERADTEWSEVDSGHRSATYRNLPAGKYVFRVQASNNDGVWNTKGVALAIRVLPPWWATWWFRSILVLLIAGTIWAIYRARVKGLQLQTVRLEAQVTQRKRAEGELRRSNEQIREMASKLLTTQEEERRRISRELHDDIVQQIAALAIGMSRIKNQLAAAGQPLAEELGGVQQRIFGLADDIRRLSHRLHPAVLEHAGLMPALKSFTEEFSKAEGIAVMLEVPEGRNVIPSEIGVCVYRVVQEWLRNIAKHAHTKSAEVNISITDNNLHLVIKDHGRGFDVDRARGSGLGLVSIEERVRLCQGTVEITSQLGQGTTLTACIPLGAVTIGSYFDEGAAFK